MMSAPYSCADHALRAAYRDEAMQICKVSDALSGKGAELTPWERLTESSMIIAAMREALPERLRDVIDVYYTVPEGMTLANRKERLARLISYRLTMVMPSVDRWYLCDVVREWADNKRARVATDQQWAKRLGVSLRTLHRWRCGRKQRDAAGIMAELDRLLYVGWETVDLAFVERGIVA